MDKTLTTVATTTTTVTATATEPTAAFAVGDTVTIHTHAPFARLGMTGTRGRGVIERIVTDTAPHPTRGQLYHVRLTDADARGWLDSGYSRNFADELTLISADASADADHAPATAPAAPAVPMTPQDGEHLGIFIFDQRADHLAHTAHAHGLWVHPACYDALRDCMRTVEHLSADFGVQFFALHIRADYLSAGGPSPAIASEGYYAATLAERTAKLRCVVQRAFDRARGMAPRDGAESEAPR